MLASVGENGPSVRRGRTGKGDDNSGARAVLFSRSSARNGTAGQTTPSLGTAVFRRSICCEVGAANAGNSDGEGLLRGSF